MFSSLFICMSYYAISVWVRVSLERENIMGIFSASYCKTYIKPTLHTTKEPPDPLKGLKDGQNRDLTKEKLNTRSKPVACGIFIHNSRIDIFSVVCVEFPHTFLLNIWFVYLIFWFVNSKFWHCPGKLMEWPREFYYGHILMQRSDQRN